MFLEYGVNEHNELVHISQSRRGKTELACPYCGGNLIARKGQVVGHHFAHIADTCREVAERDFEAISLPIYDRFQVFIPALAWDDLQVFHERGAGNMKRLEHHDLVRYNDYRRRWELTHLGGIPFGETTLQKFDAIQYEFIARRHDDLSEVVETAEYGSTWQQPRPSQTPVALADLNIYRAQLHRVLSHSLYFLEIAHDGGVIYKAGVTTRAIGERIAEIERDLHPHLGAVRIEVLRLLKHRGSIEHYLLHRYQEYHIEVGNFQEYLAFDNRRNILSDITRLGDKALQDWEQDILDGKPSAIEDRIIDNRAAETARVQAEEAERQRIEAIKHGMAKAKEQGTHVGRPAGSTESDKDILAKYPLVVEAIENGMSLRKAADYSGVSINTVRKVKVILSEG